MATKKLMNLAVLVLAISQVVHMATPRQLLQLTNPTTASSLLVISGDSPSSGYQFSHGHGAKEEKILLVDAPNVPVPPSPRLSTLAASLLITSVSGPSSDDIARPPSSVEQKVLLDAPNVPAPSSPPL